MSNKSDGFYSFRRAAIYLECFLKIPDADIHWLQCCDLLPPDGMRKRDLEFWIDGAKAAWFAKRTIVFESRPQVKEVRSPWVVVDPVITRTESRLAVRVLV